MRVSEWKVNGIYLQEQQHYLPPGLEGVLKEKSVFHSGDSRRSRINRSRSESLSIAGSH